MDKKLFDRLIQDLEELSSEIGDKNSKRLYLSQLIRIIKRLESFSGDCEECKDYLLELSRLVEELKNKQCHLEKQELKEHQQKVNKVISHLQKEHKLVTEGTYLAIYMSIGMSLGLVFGLLLLDNLAMGLPFGMIFGVAIGVTLDENAKKKGLTI
jgi:F0F1-type ATP synthase assembly protein I